MTATLDRPAALIGKESPRLATDPLRDLSDPSATLGHEAVSFAEQVLGIDLLPWQRWWLLHALELDADGGYRFRTILTLVSRQSGKTTLLKIVSLWAMFLGRAQLVLGAAQSLDIARESWSGAVELAEDNAELASEISTVRKANGEQTLTLATGARYRISAATRSAGRGLSVDLLILDELREHRDWDAWGALSKTTLARPNALTVGISNAGDDQSVVLNSLRAAALAGTDPQLAIFEWSAPDGCPLDDRDAWAQAMPGLGRTITEAAVRTAMATDPPSVFRCLDVSTPILTANGWASMGALAVGDQVKGTSGAWVDVVGASPVHYGKPCYRVTLNDGRSVVCDEEHLWTVRDRRQRRGFETLRTADLISRGVTYHNPSMSYDVRNFSLPPVAPLDGPDVGLPVDPYLLGLWLGDGSAHAAMVFVEDRDEEHVRGVMESRGAVITTRAQDSDHCWRLGFRTGGKVGHFTGALHDLGIHRNKHIPDVYFTASREQRLWLLRGLMDSDGTISKAGRCAFTNTNDKLVAGVRTLVRSLGWKTSDLEPGRYGKDHWLPRFDVCFTTRPDQPAPATIPRKVANIRAARSAYRDVRPVTIVSIEAVPSVPVRCIEVDVSDSLFLAGDLIPTHNTELLCQHVQALDSAIDPAAWQACADPSGTLADVRDRVAVCIDVSPDGNHVTLAGAALLDDGRVRVEVLAAWSSGPDGTATDQASRSFARFEGIRPIEVGWFPNGPAAAIGAELRAYRRNTRRTIAKVVDRQVIEDDEDEAVRLGAQMDREACQGLADLVGARRLLHPSDPLLDAHVAAAQRKPVGDGWRFVRVGAGHVDAAYAAAGAVYLARMTALPAATPKAMIF